VQVAGAGERFIQDRGGWSWPVRLLHFGAALPSARSNHRLLLISTANLSNAVSELGLLGHLIVERPYGPKTASAASQGSRRRLGDDAKAVTS
jgi:hypothetical protein